MVMGEKEGSSREQLYKDMEVMSYERESDELWERKEKGQSIE